MTGLSASPDDLLGHAAEHRPGDTTDVADLDNDQAGVAAISEPEDRLDARPRWTS